MRSKPSFHPSIWRKILFLFGVLLILLLAAIVVVVRVSPAIGAVGADKLRAIIGDEAVARMESVLFKIDDAVMALEYRTGLARANPPWAVTPNLPASSSPLATLPPTPLINFQATPTQGASPHPVPVLALLLTKPAACRVPYPIYRMEPVFNNSPGGSIR